MVDELGEAKVGEPALGRRRRAARRRTGRARRARPRRTAGAPSRSRAPGRPRRGTAAAPPPAAAARTRRGRSSRARRAMASSERPLVAGCCRSVRSRGRRCRGRRRSGCRAGRGAGGGRRGVRPGFDGRHRPAMRQPHVAELAGRAGDDERHLVSVEEPQALGVHRVRAQPVMAGQQRRGREAHRERVARRTRGRSANRAVDLAGRSRTPACRRRARRPPRAPAARSSGEKTSASTWKPRAGSTSAPPPSIASVTRVTT